MKRILIPLLSLLLAVSAMAIGEEKTVDVNVLILQNGNAEFSPSGFDNNKPVASTGDIVVRIHCKGGDCTGIKVKFGIPPGGADLTAEKKPVATGSNDTEMLEARLPAQNLASTKNALRIERKGQAFTIGVIKGSADTITTEAAVSDVCDTVTLGDIGLPSTDGVHFLITPGGSIQDRTTDPIDEDDSVFVHVISSDAAVLRSLEVTRASATRTTGNVSILGGAIKIIDLNKQSEGVTEPPKTCFHRTFELGDFAPGEAKVKIESRVETKRSELGMLTFNVNRLFHGIISVGPVWTPLTDHKYGLASSGSDKIIIKTENGGDDVFYAVQYTYFAHGARDVEKPKPVWRHRINPTMGFSLSGASKHALAGASLDIGHFVFTIGAHGARIDRLADGSNLKVGDKFAGAATEIPTEKKWKFGPYFAVTIDARAAQVLINAITPSN